jgi:hypothetical protein
MSEKISGCLRLAAGVNFAALEMLEKVTIIIDPEIAPFRTFRNRLGGCLSSECRRG